jgi:hypothetical protein
VSFARAFLVVIAIEALSCTQRAPSPSVTSTVTSSSPSNANGGADRLAACEPTTYPSSEDDANRDPAPSGERCPDGLVLVKGSKLAMAEHPSPHPGLAMPARRVTVGAFCVEPAPVTIGSFNGCGPCVASHGFVPGASDKPMTHAQPEEMAAYCRSVGRHLPSEVELELAVRGAEGKGGPVALPSGASELTSTEICSCTNGEGCARGLVIKGGADASSPMPRSMHPNGSKTPLRGVGFRCVASPAP